VTNPMSKGEGKKTEHKKQQSVAHRATAQVTWGEIAGEGKEELHEQKSGGSDWGERDLSKGKKRGNENQPHAKFTSQGVW